MKKGGGSESIIIVGPSKSVLVYALHSLEYVVGLARFRVFVPNLYFDIFIFLNFYIFIFLYFYVFIFLYFNIFIFLYPPHSAYISFVNSYVTPRNNDLVP